MSIFKHSSGDGQQAVAAPSSEPGAQGGQPTPATARSAVAAGVVPPPAAPIYSMRAPDAARVDGAAASSVADRLRTAREALESAQVSVDGRVRIAAQRASRSAASTANARRRLLAQQAPVQQQAHQAFDPARAAQTGLLNLAWSWQDAGAPIRAIHTYMQLLHRWPDTPAADAAVADLVELSDKLAKEGQFHMALAIYDELEHLS